MDLLLLAGLSNYSGKIRVQHSIIIWNKLNTKHSIHSSICRICTDYFIVYFLRYLSKEAETSCLLGFTYSYIYSIYLRMIYSTFVGRKVHALMSNLSSCQAVFLPEGQFVSMGQNLMSEFLMLCSSGRRSTKSQTMFSSHIRVFSTTSGLQIVYLQ